MSAKQADKANEVSLFAVKDEAAKATTAKTAKQVKAQANAEAKAEGEEAAIQARIKSACTLAFPGPKDSRKTVHLTNVQKVFNDFYSLARQCSGDMQTYASAQLNSGKTRTRWDGTRVTNESVSLLAKAIKEGVSLTGVKDAKRFLETSRAIARIQDSMQSLGL